MRRHGYTPCTWGNRCRPPRMLGMTVAALAELNSSVAGAANTDDTNARFISMIASYNLSKRTKTTHFLFLVV